MARLSFENERMGETMGERVDFPKNYEIYVKKAVRKMQEGNTKEACRWFEEAYKIRQETSLNAMYTAALYEIGKFEEAKEIADDKKEAYESHDYLSSLYIQILTKTHRFLEAEHLIQKKRNQSDDTLKEQWEMLDVSLDQERIRFEKQQKLQDQKLMKEVASLENQSFAHQTAVLKKMQDFSKSSYSAAAKEILSNPSINEIVKTTILEELIQKNDKDRFELSWFDKKRSIVPSELRSLEEHLAVKTIRKELDEKISQQDPILFQTMEQETNLQFLLIFPYIEEVITDPESWLKLCLDQYEGRDISQQEDPKMKKMSCWLERINREINQLMN